MYKYVDQNTMSQIVIFLCVIPYNDSQQKNQRCAHARKSRVVPAAARSCGNTVAFTWVCAVRSQARSAWMLGQRCFQGTCLDRASSTALTPKHFWPSFVFSVIVSSLYILRWADCRYIHLEDFLRAHLIWPE